MGRMKLFRKMVMGTEERALSRLFRMKRPYLHAGKKERNVEAHDAAPK